MYKISEFSKITGLTVKALRYYDEQYLLTPSYRCSETSYRFYADSDFKRAMLIKLLRTLDFSISEIRDVLGNYESEDDLYFYLREKQNLIRQSILSETEKLEKIESFLRPTKHSELNFQYDITLKEIKAVNVIALRFTGKYSDLDKYVPLLYRIAKDDCNGNHFNCYYDDECKEEADIELCLPVKRKISSNDVEYKTIPAIRAISTTHVGVYENLNFAYKSLFQYVNTHSIKLLAPSREIYVKGPGKVFRGNANKYVTEILLSY